MKRPSGYNEDMNTKVLFPAAIGLLCVAAAPSRAIPPGDVVLGNEVLFRLRVPAGGLSVQQRGDLLQERLNIVLAITDLHENDVTVLPTRYGPTIYVRGQKLLTVDKATADASGMKPAPLARLWARKLAAVLPEVNVRLPGGPAPAPKPAAPAGETPTPAPAPATSPATPATPAAAPATPPAPAPAPAPEPATPPAQNP